MMDASSVETPSSLPDDNNLDKGIGPILLRAASNYELFKTTSSQSIIDLVVEDYTKALTSTAADDPSFCERKERLASALLCRYRNAQCIHEDLQLAMSLAQQAVLAARTQSQRVESLSILGACLSHNYCRLAKLEYLEDGIKLLREAVDLADAHPGQSLLLVRLANALLLRFGRVGDDADVEEAVRILRPALSLSSSESTRAMVKDGLSRALHKQYYNGQGLHSVDPEECIRLSEEALLVTPTTHIHYGPFCRQSVVLISSLPGTVHRREHAMFLAKEALNAAPLGHRRRAKCSNSIALLYDYICSVSGAAEDLDQAISAAVHALECEREDYFKRAYVANLAVWYTRRFEWFAQPKDIDKAIDTLRSLEDGAEATELELVRMARQSLCNAYNSRYAWHGNVQDLEDAIYYGRLVCSTHQHSLRWQYASIALSRALLSRGLLTQHIEDVQNAIQITRDALEEIPGGFHVESEPWLHLGKMCLYLFQSSRDMDALLEAEASFRRILEHLQSTSSAADRVEAFSASATCLSQKYRCGERQALEDAIAYSHQSLLLIPDGYAIQARYLMQLGDLYALRYEVAAQPGDLQQAVSSYRKAALDGSSFVKDRFKAATSWATLEHKSRNLSEALKGYTIAIELLPRLAWLGMDRETRFKEIMSQSSSLACDAAACACEMHLFENAVELLEQARAVFWQQHLSLRSETEELFEAAPLLANELRDVGRALEVEAPCSNDQDLKRSLQNRRRLAERWDELISEVRGIDGFQDFLRPATFQRLRQSASGGPVVILNISTFGCAALIITFDYPVHHIPLPAVRHAKLKSTAELLRKSLSIKRDSAGALFLERVTRGVMEQLWKDVGVPVWAVLSQGLLSRSTRIWWLPTGPICLLPIHAASPSATGQPGFPDLVTSSYTTTLGALISARQRHRDRKTALSILAVCPATAEDLPRVDEEMDVICHAAADVNIVILRAEDASIAGVQDALKSCTWAHFACHGKQEQERPLDSCLSLYDGPFSVSTIIESRLDNAEFAFLSACHTAKGIYSVPDEAMHFTAGLQLAGFQSIVATLWSIYDVVAPTVSDVVYRHLMRDGHAPDHRDAADGLRIAITKLRNLGVPAHGWVPFVHVGV